MRYRFDVPLDCSVELSPVGYQFFTDIFEVFDKVFFCSDLSLLVGLTVYCQDKDGALNKDELEALFSTAPPGIPWRDQKFPGLDDEGAVTLQAWLARWR
jgi:Ras family protein T1